MSFMQTTNLALSFGGAIIALARAGQPILAWIFAVLLGLNRFLLYAWKQ